MRVSLVWIVIAGTVPFSSTHADQMSTGCVWRSTVKLFALRSDLVMVAVWFLADVSKSVWRAW